MEQARIHISVIIDLWITAGREQYLESVVSVKLPILLQNDKFHPVHVFPSKNMDIKTTGRKEKQNHPDIGFDGDFFDLIRAEQKEQSRRWMGLF